MTRIWLHGNKVQIDYFTIYFTIYKILSIFAFKLQKLPFILNCETLSEIYLQHNLIQSIDNCFRNLVNIEVLFLNGNQLTDLKNVGHELSYLKYLKNLSKLINYIFNLLNLINNYFLFNSRSI